MSNDPRSRKEDEDRERTPQPPVQGGGCPKCGGAVKTNMFRTGSVNHPGRPMNVCTHCGTRS